MKCSHCEIELNNFENTTVCGNCGAICSVVEFINLTPHTVNEITTGNSYPSKGIARVEVKETKKCLLNNVPIYYVDYGNVMDLPEPKDLVFYIVSLMVKEALPNRKDLLSPGELVRNSEGQPIGCKGFRI